MKSSNMTQMFVRNISSRFDRYAEQTADDNPDVAFFLEMKRYHTHQVRDNARKIAESLNLDGADICLAETIALLHDVGRFPQMVRYKTFNDSISEDHSILALGEIRRLDFLNGLSDSVVRIIEAAVMNHNKKHIDARLNEKEVLFAKLIRDADKIDIYRVVSDHHKNAGESRESRTIVLDYPHADDISHAVYEDIISRRIVERSHVKSRQDHIALQAAWVFDINFPITLELIRDHRYVQQSLGYLPETGRVREIRNIITGVLGSTGITQEHMCGPIGKRENPS